MTLEAVPLRSKDTSIKVDLFYGQGKIRVLSGENSEFDRLLSAVRREENGGEPFRENLTALTTIMGEQWYKAIDIEGNEDLVVGIAIPRGGIPMGTGLRQILPAYPHFESNDGRNRDATKPLLPADFPHQFLDHVIIADTVVGTGHTILRTIEEIDRTARVRFFHIFSAVASGYGVREILKTRPYGLRMYVGCIEEKTEWVVKDGKPVLFVAGIGDAGDLVSR